jgi:hypothetical protein
MSDNIALFNESAFEPVLSVGGVAGLEKGGVTQVGGVSDHCFVRPALKSKPTHDSRRLFNRLVSSRVHRSQLMFNPTRPHILYAAFRRSERLWSWDLRGHSSVPLCCFSRGVTSNEFGHKNLTNQKRQFDVDSTGRWLASGNQVCPPGW